MKNYELINELIEARGYESYFEKNIVSSGLNYAHVKCAHKQGSSHANTILNTKEKVREQYDVFVLNHSGQTLRTFVNHIITSLKYVKKGGVMIIPKVDCPNELLGAEWNRPRNGESNHRGEVWKAWWLALPEILAQAGYYTVLTDTSAGIIDLRAEPVSTDVPKCTDTTTWVEFWGNRDTILRPVTPETFLSFVKGDADLTFTNPDNEVSVAEAKPKRKKKATTETTEEETGDPT